jgi:hypothetical protein
MDWSEKEIRLIIEDYFSMLQMQLKDIPYNKSEHRRALVSKIGRSEGSVEFKHRNISAILDLLGFEYLSGYLPAKNYQRLLSQVIEETLASAHLETELVASEQLGFGESAGVFSEPPPDRLLLPEKAPEYIQRLARKFDPARRDMQNRALGMVGERLIFEREKELLTAENRLDLAKKIEWTSQEKGDGAGYDIKSFRLDGSEKFIEVKTTNGSKRTPFYISDNELEFSHDAAQRYQLSRLYDFRKGARLYELSAPLDTFIFLKPNIYRAGFGDE